MGVPGAGYHPDIPLSGTGLYFSPFGISEFPIFNKISSPSPQPKKPPADGPHSDVSILERAANSLRSLTACHNFVLCLFSSVFPPCPSQPGVSIGGHRPGTPRAASRRPHRDSSVEPGSPELPPSCTLPIEALRTVFSTSQTNSNSPAQHRGAPPGAVCQPQSSAWGTAWLSHPHPPLSPGRYSRCHPSSRRHRRAAGTSFPFLHPPARFFTRNDFQVSASPSSPTSRFHTHRPQASFP